MQIDELPFIDIAAEAFTSDPEDAVADVRDNTLLGLARSARGVEVLRHGACQELYRDQRFFQGTDDMYEAIGITEGPVYRTFKESLINIEGADHARQRRVVMPYFTPKRNEQLRADVRGWLAQWMAEATARDDFDVHTIIARRLPSTLFCRMVGTPLADSEVIADLSEQLMLIFTFDPSHRESVIDAHTRIQDYILELVEDRERHPADDLISAMLEAERGGELTRQELVDLGILMLFGSTDTTSAQICLNVHALGRNPEQWERLRREPELVPSATQELVRYQPGAMSVTRIPPADADFAGIHIPADTVMWIDVFAGNKDPLAYVDPRCLDITRPPKPSPLNFGMGRHSCIGRGISLVEQEEVLRAMLQHWIGFDVIDEPELVGAPVMASMPSLKVAPAWKDCQA